MITARPSIRPSSSKKKTHRLTDRHETIVIEKTPTIDIAPKKRPRKVYGGMWGQTEIATVASVCGEF
jgi:hypothetical protein